MRLQPPFRPLAFALILLLIASCSSSTSSVASVEESAAESTEAPEAAATEESAAEPTSEPTATAEPTPTTEPTAPPEPTADPAELAAELLPEAERGEVTVLEVGEDPQLLRFDLRETDGQATRSTQSIDQLISQNISGIANEFETQITMTMSTEVEQSADGTAWIVTQTLDEVDVSASTDDIAELTRATLADAIGVENRLTVSPTGTTEVLPSDSTDPSFLEQAQGLSDETAIVFPDEEIGVGGSWQVTTLLDSPGLQIQQTIVYEVTAIEGSTVELAVTGEQTPIGVMDLGAGLTVESFEMATDITGTAVIDLTSPVWPSTISADSDLSLSGSDGTSSTTTLDQATSTTTTISLSE